MKEVFIEYEHMMNDLKPDCKEEIIALATDLLLSGKYTRKDAIKDAITKVLLKRNTFQVPTKNKILTQ